MDKIIEAIKNFVMSGNNLYVIIGIGAVIVALLVAIIVTSIKKKQVEKQVAEEEQIALEEENQASKPLDIETIVLSPIVDEPIPQNDVVVVASEGTTRSTDETVIMTPVREKQRPQKKNKQVELKPEERTSSFVEKLPSGEDGKRPGSIQIYVDNGTKYRFRFRSSNNNVVGHSLGYDAKSVCKAKIQYVLDIAQVASVADTTNKSYVKLLGKARFEIYKDKEDKFRFKLVTSGDESLLYSQGYTTKANCLNGVESVRRVTEYHNLIDDAK